MDRRELLSALGAGAVGMATLSRTVHAAADPEEHAHHRDQVHEDCMKACNDCSRACNETAAHCLEQLAAGSGDRKIHAQVHARATDCQAFCTLSSTMMERDSELMAYSCQACAEACRACAEACDRHPASEMVKQCAEKCRACERACMAMVKSMRGRNA
jgi:hypothetical protein